MTTILDEETVARWSSVIKPFPLPDYNTPTDGAPLSTVDDEVLMNAPPHLIVHVQRTAAQGGLQVLSPRQTPFTSLMTRNVGGDRQLGDHVVGSIADPSARWPTLDNFDFSELLPDEPLPTTQAEHAKRDKTRTEPLTKAGRLLSDPILSCLVKGRAVIDVLRRDDVAGGAETMTEVLADAWGIDKKDVDDLDAYTLGIQGPLLRHAIKVDDVYPMTHAPIHVRRSISMGVSEVTRALLPDDTALDWRRMRVFCESVFLMACMTEGLPVKYMRCYPPPGDPSAKTNRRGVMVFQPAPATAWTFAPNTFSIYPTSGLSRTKGSQIPREVYEALARYTAVVRPVSYAMALGHRAVTRRSTIVGAEVPPGETISDAYRLLAKTMVIGSVRGRTAAATVRNLIYSSIEAAPLTLRMRLARYLMIAPAECKSHLGLTELPDLLIDRIATKFSQIGELVRVGIVSEAARRGATAEEWWADISAQTPERYKMMAEGTMGWAKIAMWLVFRSPTERWSKLVKAVNYTALRDAARQSVGAMALPAEKGSKERLLAAAQHAAKSISRAYAGYYIGVADVGMALSDVADMMGRQRTAEILREASYLWILRARCLRGINVHPISREVETPSTNHLRVFSEPIDLYLAPTPYRAFDAYVRHVETSGIVSSYVKTYLRGFNNSRISMAFQDLARPIVVAKKTLLTAFLTNPSDLGNKMEKAWRELTDDIRTVASIYGANETVRTISMPEIGPSFTQDCGLDFDVGAPVPDKMDYFSILATLEDDEVDWMEDTCDRLPAHVVEEVNSRTYTGPQDLRDLLLSMDQEYNVKPQKVMENIR